MLFVWTAKNVLSFKSWLTKDADRSLFGSGLVFFCRLMVLHGRMSGSQNLPRSAFQPCIVFGSGSSSTVSKWPYIENRRPIDCIESWTEPERPV